MILDLFIAWESKGSRKPVTGHIVRVLPLLREGPELDIVGKHRADSFRYLLRAHVIVPDAAATFTLAMTSTVPSYPACNVA